MRFLLLGKGAREHALAWALNRSPLVDDLHCMPGNGGIVNIAETHEGDPEDVPSVCGLCRRVRPDLVVVGPEAPLVAGVADALAENGFLTFGPGSSGARLEGSKAFAKTFMARHGIPTADFDICSTVQDAKKAISKRHPPFIVKADGLAAGKGVFIAETQDEALDASKRLLEDNILGEAGRKIVIEDHLIGKELTVLVVTDGKSWKQLPPSQDHKRAFDGDRGPNTGGMGAFCPVPWTRESFLADVEERIVAPTIKGLGSEAIPFRGTLYFGLMVDENGTCKVLEYNVRMGDPETQAVLPVFPGDFAEAALAAAKGDLDNVPWTPTGASAVGVVMASGGYPESYKTGFEIQGTEKFDDSSRVLIFHGGTRRSCGRLLTDGGRVLTVVGVGGNVAIARDSAYEAVREISFRAAHYRKDIAAFEGGE